LKTPGGWALAGMWYEKFHGMPPRGSPLERLFTLVYLSKKRADLLATRALVQASMPETKEAQDPVIKAFDAYCNNMFPFLERAADMDKENERKQLLEFVKRPARFDLRPIWSARKAHARRLATRSRFSLNPTVPTSPFRMEKVRSPRRSL